MRKYSTNSRCYQTLKKNYDNKKIINLGEVESYDIESNIFDTLSETRTYNPLLNRRSEAMIKDNIGQLDLNNEGEKEKRKKQITEKQTY